VVEKEGFEPWVPTLAFLVVEKVTAKRQKVMRREFLLQEIDYCIFGSGAPLLPRHNSHSKKDATPGVGPLNSCNPVNGPLIETHIDAEHRRLQQRNSASL